MTRALPNGAPARNGSRITADHERVSDEDSDTPASEQTTEPVNEKVGEWMDPSCTGRASMEFAESDP